MSEARGRIRAQEGVRQAAQRSDARTESRYKQGLINLSELTDAELAPRQAQTNRLQAVYDYPVAKADLGRAAGW